MKVTFCTYDRPGYVGGPNAGLKRLLPALKERGVLPELLLLTFGDLHQCPFIKELHKLGIPYQSSPYHKTTEKRVRWIIDAVRKRSTDVFVPNLMPAAYLASSYLKSKGIPSIGVLRSDDDFHWQLVDTFIRGRKKELIKNWVTVSAFLKDAIEKDIHNVRQIPSSAELYTLIAPPAPADPLRIIYSGRLAEKQKRISLVTENLCTLTEAMPSVEATILGDGPDREAVVSLIENHPKAKVTLLDAVDSSAVGAILAQHHAVILMSEYEGLPLSFLEGMGAGLIPLSTPMRSGIPELIRHKKTGFILEDPTTDLPKAIKELQDPKTFQNLSMAAAALVRKTYSPEKCADDWTHMILKVGKTASPRPIAMPVRLNLPSHNGIREDDRGSIRECACAAVSSLLPQSHPFLHPRCTPRFIDLYPVRTNILHALKKALPDMTGTVVDIGAGTAPYRNLYLDKPGIERYLTVDLADNPYASPDIIWDGYTLPLNDNSVDVVVMTEVLEHCPTPAALLKETHRILKPKGLIFGTVPFLWPLHDIPYDISRHTPWAIKTMLDDIGFIRSDIQALGGFDGAMGQMVGLWVRRRSSNSGYQKYIRPLLSLCAAPLVWTLTKIDKRPKEFREGLMITGLSITARKDN